MRVHLPDDIGYGGEGGVGDCGGGDGGSDSGENDGDGGGEGDGGPKQ